MSKRPTIIIDLKQCIGEVALFLGVRPRFTLLDAIETSIGSMEFLSELVVEAQLWGSISWRAPSSPTAERTGVPGLSSTSWGPRTQTYDYIVIDADTRLNYSCASCDLYFR